MVGLWDTDSGTEANLNHEAAVGGVAFSPDGPTLASFSADHLVHLWDVVTGQGRATLQGHTDVINGIHFSPDGQILVSYGNDMTVRLWDAETGNERAVLEGHVSPVVEADFSSDGSVLASTSGGSLLSTGKSEVRLWDTASGLVLAVLPGDADNIRRTAFSPDGSTLVILAANFVKIYGIPTEARPVTSVPGIIVPISVNLRAAPSLDAEIIGIVNSGTVLVGGRDASGRFVYLIEEQGWVWSERTYIDLGSVSVDDLPVIEP
jgi:WD40 repeat protein